MFSNSFRKIQNNYQTVNRFYFSARLFKWFVARLKFECEAYCERLVKCVASWSAITARGKTRWFHYQFLSHAVSFIRRLFELSFLQIFLFLFVPNNVNLKWSFERLCWNYELKGSKRNQKNSVKKEPTQKLAAEFLMPNCCCFFFLFEHRSKKRRTAFVNFLWL